MTQKSGHNLIHFAMDRLEERLPDASSVRYLQVQEADAISIGDAFDITYIKDFHQKLRLVGRVFDIHVWLESE